MHLQGEGYDPTHSTQPRTVFYKLACGFSPVITPICEGAHRHITAAVKGSVRAQLGYCMTQPYEEARALLMHRYLKNTRQKESCKSPVKSKGQAVESHESFLPLLPSSCTCPSPSSALFTNKMSNLHPPLYLNVFTFFTSRLASI